MTTPHPRAPRDQDSWARPVDRLPTTARTSGQDTVTGDVVGAWRPGTDDALKERLAHVVLVDELHRHRRHDDRDRHRQPGGCRGHRPAHRGQRPRKQVLGAEGVRAEDDRRAEQIQRGHWGHLGLDRPLIGVPSLRAMVEGPLSESHSPCAAVGDAHREELFVAVYTVDRELCPPTIVPPGVPGAPALGPANP